MKTSDAEISKVQKKLSAIQGARLLFIVKVGGMNLIRSIN